MTLEDKMIAKYKSYKETIEVQLQLTKAQFYNELKDIKLILLELRNGEVDDEMNADGTAEAVDTEEPDKKRARNDPHSE